MFKKSSFSSVGSSIVNDRDDKKSSSQCQPVNVDDLLDKAIQEKDKGINQKHKQINKLKKHLLKYEDPKTGGKRDHTHSVTSVYDGQPRKRIPVPARTSEKEAEPEQSFMPTPISTEFSNNFEDSHGAFAQLSAEELEEKTFGWMIGTPDYQDNLYTSPQKKKAKPKKRSPKVFNVNCKLEEMKAVYHQKSSPSSRPREKSSGDAKGKVKKSQEASEVSVEYPITEFLASLHRRFVTNTALIEVRYSI